jgi:hypothetical protein
MFYFLHECLQPILLYETVNCSISLKRNVFFLPDRDKFERLCHVCSFYSQIWNCPRYNISDLTIISYPTDYGATCGAETASPSRAPGFTLGFSGVRVAQSLAFNVVLIIVYPFVHFFFGHCIVCSSSIHGFCLPLQNMFMVSVASTGLQISNQPSTV